MKTTENAAAARLRAAAPGAARAAYRRAAYAAPAGTWNPPAAPRTPGPLRVAPTAARLTLGGPGRTYAA